MKKEEKLEVKERVHGRQIARVNGRFARQDVVDISPLSSKKRTHEKKLRASNKAALTRQPNKAKLTRQQNKKKSIRHKHEGYEDAGRWQIEERPYEQYPIYERGRLTSEEAFRRTVGASQRRPYEETLEARRAALAQRRYEDEIRRRAEWEEYNNPYSRSSYPQRHEEDTYDYFNPSRRGIVRANGDDYEMGYFPHHYDIEYNEYVRAYVPNHYEFTDAYEEDRRANKSRISNPRTAYHYTENYEDRHAASKDRRSPISSDRTNPRKDNLRSDLLKKIH